MTVYNVRFMIGADCDEAAACGAGNVDDMKKLMQHRDVLGIVAAHPLGPVDGYVIYHLKKSSLQILELVGHPLAWQDVVQTLVNKLLSKLSFPRRDHISFVVNERFTPMLQLLKSMGFTATLQRGKFGNSDGIKMVFRLQVPQAS